ncbi:hypothetical protein [Brachybacterium alimentarium]|uniref:hypothetical protein n=1 Tax=Brachybacterium alimentarium TaxID=47845 RepID=UPI003FD498C5
MTDPNFAAAAPAGGAPVSKTKWIVQLVVSAITMVLCSPLQVVTVILAIIGLVKAGSDLTAANKLYKWGWIVYAVIWVITIILWIVLFATGVFSAIIDGSSTTTY